MIALGLALALLACCATPAAAQRWKYPPGQPNRSCPDTLTIFDVQQSDTLLAPCHPATLDTVWGVRGIITAFDGKASAYSFYIQNTFASGPSPWTGVNVFTGATNYHGIVSATPTGGSLQLGDSVAVYGTTQEFPAVVGETEIEGPDVSQSTNDILIRRISSGNPLPSAKIGTTTDFNYKTVLSAATAEPWEGCLVRINGPLRVARTQTGAGVAANTFLIVNPNAPSDSVLIDGLTLTTLGAPPVGADIDFIQGILNQRTGSGVNSYRIQVRDADDYSIQAPPNLVDAYPLEDDKLRLIFDKNLDLTTAQNEANYSFVSNGTVDLATLVGGAGAAVDLDITTALADGAAQQVRAQGIATSTCPTCLSGLQTLGFVNGVLTVATVQAPDPTHFSPCDDRSRFAGTGSAPGSRLTVRGIAVQRYGTNFYVADAVSGQRTGVQVFAPPSELENGHRYRIAGNVQEFFGETEIVNVVSILDEGLATVPSPVVQTVAALRDTACDPTQSATTGEDYEGGLVRVEEVRVVRFNTAPFDPVAGGSFRIVQPAGPAAPDTMLVFDLGGRYAFNADTGMVLTVSGILRVSSGTFQILPRSDSDITTLIQVEPNRGGDQGPVSVVIAGAGFLGGTTARLARPGQSDIPGSLTTVASDGRSLATNFDLSGRTAGLWDVVVTYPNSSTTTLTSGFTIEPSTPRQLRVDVIGRSSIRPDRRRAFDVVIENLGNSDALSVPLWIARIPEDATIDLDFPLTPAPQSGGEPDWSQVPLTLSGPGGKYLAVVIPRLPPGPTTRRFYLTVPNTVASFEVNAALTPPWVDGNVLRSCLSGAGVITSPSCTGAQLTANNAYLATTSGIQAMSGIGLWAKVAWQCESAASLPAALMKAEQVLDYMLQPIEGATLPSECATVLRPQWQDSLSVRVVTSMDPNDKIGTRGVGTNRQIGSQQLLPYLVQFENLQNATAPAQDVLVIDALDASKFDLATVSLGLIKFGKRANGLPWTIEPPPGLSTYTTDLDMRPEKNLIVRVGFNLDRASGLTAWSMSSIDPATGQSPLDDQVGFLPRNAVSPEGEGSVSLTLMPKLGLANGTQISNQASIVFDGVPLGTAPWSNTLDTGAPQSHMLPLGTQQDSASFTVRWELTGVFPDFRDFSIYVSQNGAEFRPWRLHTQATADTIGAPAGGSYAFYSLARDSSGNLEAVPTSPDVQTFSRVAVEDGARPQLALEGAVPNPVFGEARVWFTLPSRERAVLEVMDVAGRRVVRREVGQFGPGRHSVDVSASVPSPGLYFLRLVKGGQVLRARMAVIH